MTTEQEDETGITLSLIFYCIHKKAAWQLFFSLNKAVNLKFVEILANIALV